VFSLVNTKRKIQILLKAPSMKYPFILLISFISVLSLSAQKTWTGPATGGNWATATNWSGNQVPVTNDIVIFPTGITGTVSNVNAGANITLAGLVIQGNSDITLTNSANKTITISNGAGANDLDIAINARLTIGTNVDLTLGSGTTTNITTANIAGIFVIGANRTFDTNNGNVLTTVTGSILNSGTVAGNTARLSFSNGSSYEHARAGGSIPNASWGSSSTCRITGLTNADAGNDNQAFGNVEIDCPNMTGTRTLGPNGLSIAGNFKINNTGTAVLKQGLAALTIGGDFEVYGGTFRVGDNTNRSITINGNFKITGGTLELSTGNNAADRGTLNIAGDFQQSGGTITETNSGRGTINFTGTGTQHFNKILGSTIAGNIDFNINAGASVDFGTSILDGSTGNFVLNSGAKLTTSNSNGFNGNGANNGTIQLTGTKTYSSTADYEFKGSATGIFTTTTNPQVRNFTVNNTSGSVTLSQPMTVTGTLILTAGALVTTSTNLLTIGSTGSSTAATNSSFVNGPIAKVFAAPLSGFTFPVGKIGTGYRNIGITAPSAASTFKAEFFRAVPPAGTLAAGITRLSACEYWDLSRTAGAAGTSARVILSWSSNSACTLHPYVTDQTTLKVAHLSGGTWINEGYLASTGNPGNGTITSGNAPSTFSPFALAGSGAADNPLAVLFDNVKATKFENKIRIEWTNLTEKEVAFYSVERSSDGINFKPIAKQSARNNQNEEASYEAVDENPRKGKNFYRVLAREQAGQNLYSKVLVIDFTNNILNGISIFPNPVRGNTITLGLGSLQAGTYELRIFNSSGQLVQSQKLLSRGGEITQVLSLSSSIKAGLHNVVLTGEGTRESKSFIYQ
jgi:hypothetical protein